MVKATRILLIILFILINHVSALFSQISMYGGRGLMRILSANVITPADIYINSYFSMYFKKIGPESLSKYYLMHLNGTFGLSRYMEVSCHFVPYQDDQKHILGRMGDTKLALKYMFPFSTSTFQIGVQGFFKFPTAQVPNVPYEVFSTDKAAWGSRTLFTFDFSKTINAFPFKIYTNIGYYDQNVTDTFFSSKIDQILFGVGIKLPVRSTQIFLEYTGEIFFNNPDSVAFSENSNRITSGITFLGPWGFSFDVVADIGLTDYNSSIHDNIFHKEYSDWRIWFGLSYRLSVYKYFDKSAKLAKEKREQELRKLEKIKNKRKKANDDMEKMKELLKKKNPENP